MGRPAKVDDVICEQLIKEGKTDTEIAAYFEVKRQAIAPHRKKIEQRIRDDSSKTEIAITKPKVKRENYTWTEIQEAIVQTFQQAKRAEELADENWRLRNRNAGLENALAEEREKTKSSQEYELLIKQGKIPTPLIIKDDKHKLTKS